MLGHFHVNAPPCWRQSAVFVHMNLAFSGCILSWQSILFHVQEN